MDSQTKERLVGKELSEEQEHKLTLLSHDIRDYIFTDINEDKWNKRYLEIMDLGRMPKLDNGYSSDYN
jgi:hypothetical protein